VQEIGEDAVDRLRRRRHPQDAAVAAPQQLRPLAERADRAKHGAAIVEQLLALAGQHQPAADPVEQLDAKLLLEIADLAGKGGLRNAQVQGRLRDGALLGNGDERAQVPEIHGSSLCLFGMN
jgi:hypothetical protein